MLISAERLLESVLCGSAGEMPLSNAVPECLHFLCRSHFMLYSKYTV